MASYVREVGHVETIDGTRIHVGVDYDSVRIRGDGHLNAAQAESFAQLFVRATWLAGQVADVIDDRGDLT